MMLDIFEIFVVLTSKSRLGELFSPQQAPSDDDIERLDGEESD